MQSLDYLAEKVSLSPQIDQALKAGFDLVVSISGGKDSDAMTRVLHHMRFHQARAWTGRMILLHSDLGRAEHNITPRYIERFAQCMDLPLHVIQGGDLVDVMKARKSKLNAQGKDIPFWPSAKARYCTSDLKRSPISKFLRHWTGKQGRVVCAIGLRAEESSARAKKPIMKQRTGVHTKTRMAYDWLPIHHFTLTDVWNAIGYELDEIRAIQVQNRGLSPETLFHTQPDFHPAYSQSNERLSCALCIFGSLGDLKNGAAQNPAVYREYVQMEIDTGFSFQPKRWLGDVAPDLLTPEMRVQLEQAKSPKKLHQPSTTTSLRHHIQKKAADDTTHQPNQCTTVAPLQLPLF